MDTRKIEVIPPEVGDVADFELTSLTFVKLLPT